MRAECAAVLHIEQFGSTRSINAGGAAAIAMHAWVREHAGVGDDRGTAPVADR
jgi:tRNA G18 (ribose-2'-O)-methylase SpoU